MKKKMTLRKRGLALFLALIMCTGLFPITASAENENECAPDQTEVSEIPAASNEDPIPEDGTPDSSDAGGSVLPPEIPAPEEPEPVPPEPVVPEEPVPPEQIVPEEPEEPAVTPEVVPDPEQSDDTLTEDPPVLENTVLPGIFSAVPINQDQQILTDQVLTPADQFVALVSEIPVKGQITDANREEARTKVHEAQVMYDTLTDTDRSDPNVVEAQEKLISLTENTVYTSAHIFNMQIENADCYYLYWNDNTTADEIRSMVPIPVTDGYDHTISQFSLKENDLHEGGYSGYILFVAVPWEGCVLTDSKSSGYNDRYLLSKVPNHNNWGYLWNEAVSVFQGQEWYQEGNVAFRYCRKPYDGKGPDITTNIAGIMPELKVTVDTSIGEDEEIREGTEVVFTISVEPVNIGRLNIKRKTLNSVTLKIGDRTESANCIGNDDGTYTVYYTTKAGDSGEIEVTVDATIVYDYGIPLTQDTLITTAPVNSSSSASAKLLPKYDVVFHANPPDGITEIPAVPPAQRVYKGDCAENPVQSPAINGYQFDGWYTKSDSIDNLYNFITPVTSNVDLYAHWIPCMEEMSYTVEYYKDHKVVAADTQIEKQTMHVLQQNCLPVEKSRINTTDKYTAEGYIFNKTEPSDIPDTVPNGSIIKVFYIADSAQRKELTYTVEYYKDDNLVPEDTKTVKKDVQILHPDILPVESDINPANKYSGYRFEKTEPASIPATIASGETIRVYYVTDDKQTKELTYTVEYYKDDKLVPEDTQTVKEKVHILEPETLTVKKEDINTDDKYEGFAVEKTIPAEIPDIVEDGTVIQVYYVTIPPKGHPKPDPDPKPEEKPEPDPKPEEKPEEPPDVKPDPAPGADPAPDPAPVPDFTPFPDSVPGTTTVPDSDPDDLTTIEEEEVPLAGAIGLNNTDHFAYIIGYENDTVHPTADITRAEVATIFFRLMTDEYRTANWAVTNDFSDVDGGRWYNNAISTCASAGLLTGYENGAFRADRSITRAEFAAIASRFLGDEVTGDKVGDFSDTEGHWAAKEIRRAAEAGWVTGSGKAFRPDEEITRAEVMTIVNRMLDRVPDAGHMLENMKEWSDNPEGTWYYEAVQEATNEHAYERDELGVMETWTTLLTVRDWRALETQWAASNLM